VRRFLTLSVCMLAIWAGVPVQGQSGRTYTTNFPATENPLSEGGNWRNGQREGIDWKDFRTVPGLALGTQLGSPPPYDDSTAVVTGTWGPDQTVEMKVKTVNQQTGSVNQELEVRLRTTINPHSLTGYEVLWRLNHDGSQYHQIVQWLGPLGTASCNWGCAFQMVPGSRDMRAGDGNPGVYDGDTLGASIVGNRIRTWVIHNGVKQILQDINDTSGAGGGARFTSGAPGMGAWLRGPVSTITDYGVISFTAVDTGVSSSAPAAPTNLRITRAALRIGGVPLIDGAADALSMLLPAAGSVTH
jgi:hypothetical protein